MHRDFVPDLANCSNLPQLATALGVDLAVLQQLTGNSLKSQYRIHRIPKRSRRRPGEFRVVYEPVTEELRHIHRTIGRRLGLYLSQAEPTFPAVCSYAYIRKRSIWDNANKHCGARLLLRADIKDFFPTITRDRLHALLIRTEIQPDLAAALAQLFCVEGTLSPGLSGAAVLANFACHDLDQRMLTLSKPYGATYTRYADDMAISGDQLPSKAEVSGCLDAEGFTLSSAKFRILKRGQAQFVTGLSISDTTRPHVPRTMKRRLRQELYYSRKFGIHEHLAKLNESMSQGLNRIDGMVTYVSFIEKDTSYDLKERWQALLARDDLTPKVHPRHDRPPTQQYLVVDETEIELKNGDKAIILGGALFSERLAIETLIQRVRDDYIADPYSAGDRAAIRKQGLHYVAAHPDLRTSFIQRLATLPFRCYVTVKRIGTQDSYAEVYMQAFKWLLIVLYQRCDRQKLSMLIEQNSKITETALQNMISEYYRLLTEAGRSRPLAIPDLQVISKKELTVSLPDFMLAVLTQYTASTSEKDGTVALTQFERLRDRYSLIYDVDHKKAYRRRNPFQSNSLDSPLSD